MFTRQTVNVNANIRLVGEQRTTCAVWRNRFVATMNVLRLRKEEIAQKFERLTVSFDQNGIVHGLARDLRAAIRVAGTYFISRHKDSIFSTQPGA